MTAMKTIEAKLKRVIAALIATSIIYVAFFSRLSLHLLPSTAHAQFQSMAVRTAFTEEQQHLLRAAAGNETLSATATEILLLQGASAATETNSAAGTLLQGERFRSFLGALLPSVDTYSYYQGGARISSYT
jgi:hypothetical protein